MFLLVSFDVGYGFVNIPLLAAFISSAKQEYEYFSDHGVIHSVARSSIDNEFPDIITAETVNTQISILRSIDGILNCFASAIIVQVIKPLLKDVASVFSIVNDSVLYAHDG